MPEQADYATRLEAFDTREASYKYRLAALSVPGCLDATNPDHVATLRQLLIEQAGWTSIVQEYPTYMRDYPLKAGTADYRWLLDGTLGHMDELRAARLENGDTAVQAEFDALSVAHSSLVDLTAAHPARTWSSQMMFDASECNEKAALLIDLESGLALFVFQPAQC